jgi:hypothetical protein
LLVAGCATTTTTTTTTTTAAEVASVEVAVNDETLRVLVADDPAERTEGLRNIEQLPAGIDGMLFVFPDSSVPTFVMLDAVIPLDVWFFDDNGELIGSAAMQPCAEEPCPRYPAPGEVRWALETPLGTRQYQPGDILTTSASG